MQVLNLPPHPSSDGIMAPGGVFDVRGMVWRGGCGSQNCVWKIFGKHLIGTLQARCSGRRECYSGLKLLAVKQGVV